MPVRSTPLEATTAALAATDRKLEQLKNNANAKFHRRGLVGIEKSIGKVPEVNSAQTNILKNWEYKSQVFQVSTLATVASLSLLFVQNPDLSTFTGNFGPTTLAEMRVPPSNHSNSNKLLGERSIRIWAQPVVPRNGLSDGPGSDVEKMNSKVTED